MPTQKLTKDILTAAIEGFEAQKKSIGTQIAELRQMLAGGPVETATTPVAPTRKRKNFSAAARRKMALAQKARWARIKGESESPAPATPKPAKAKRKLSAAGRRAIAEAARKRWAAIKAAKETPPTTQKAVRKAAKKKATVKKAAVKVPATKAAKKGAPAKKAVVKKAFVKKPTATNTAPAAQAATEGGTQ